MKTVGWILLFSLALPAMAGNSGTLFLKGRVPARTKVTTDPARGTFHIHSNTGKFALMTYVTQGRDLRGFRIITVTPQ